MHVINLESLGIYMGSLSRVRIYMAYSSKLIPLFPFILQSKWKENSVIVNLILFIFYFFLENRLLTLHAESTLDGMQPYLVFGALGY